MNTIAEILKSIESALHRHVGFALVELQARMLVSAATGVALPQLDAFGERRLSDIVQAAGEFERPKTLAGTCGGARLVVAKKAQMRPPNQAKQP